MTELTANVDGGGAAPGHANRIDGGPAGVPTAPAPPLSRGPLRQGDPRLIMGPDGTRLAWVGGQPVMDGGFENQVLISLFTNEGWCGNAFMKSPTGSRFEAACNQPITRQSLNDIRMAAEGALKHPAFGNVSVTVANPTGYNLTIRITIAPPRGVPQDITLRRIMGVWSTQANDPAHRRLES